MSNLVINPDKNFVYDIVSDLQGTEEYEGIRQEILEDSSLVSVPFPESDIDGITAQEWLNYLIVHHDQVLSDDQFANVGDLLLAHLPAVDVDTFDDLGPVFPEEFGDDESPIEMLADYLVTRGNAELSSGGDLGSSAQYYGLALLVNPQNARALNNLGIYYERLGDKGYGSELKAEAFALDPDNADIRQNQGFAISSVISASFDPFTDNPSLFSGAAAVSVVVFDDADLLNKAIPQADIVGRFEQALRSAGFSEGVIQGSLAEQALTAMPEEVHMGEGTMRAFNVMQNVDAMRENIGVLVKRFQNFPCLFSAIFMLEGGRLVIDIRNENVSTAETVAQVVPTATASTALYFSLRAFWSARQGEALLAVKFGLQRGPWMGLTVTGEGIVGLTRDLVRDDAVSTPEYIADGMTVASGLGYAAVGGGLVLLGITPPGWVVYAVAGASTVCLIGAHFLDEHFRGDRVSSSAAEAIRSSDEQVIRHILDDPHDEFDSVVVSQLVWDVDEKGHATFLGLVDRLQRRNPKLCAEFLAKCYDRLRSQIWISDKDAAALYVLGLLTGDSQRTGYALHRTDSGDLEEYGKLRDLLGSEHFPTVEDIQREIDRLKEAS